MGCTASHGVDRISEIKLNLPTTPRHTREEESPVRSRAGSYVESAMRSRTGSMADGTGISPAKKVSFGDATVKRFQDTRMLAERSSQPDLLTSCDFDSFRFIVENFPKALLKKVELKRLRDFGNEKL